jgi:hypothetical protein
MGMLVPNAAQGRDLDQIFKHKLPKIRETEDTRYLIEAEIIAYCTSTALSVGPFKHPSGRSAGDSRHS